MTYLHHHLQGQLLLGASHLQKGRELGTSHGKPLAKPKLQVQWELNIFNLQDGDHTCQLLVFPKPLSYGAANA